MRHRFRGRILGRKPPHQLALKRNLATALFAHEQIITTVAKAKELRPFAERLITIAKSGALGATAAGDEKARKLVLLNARRRLIELLGGKKFVIIKDEEINVIDKLLADIGPRFADRPGGYTRVMKRTERRLGDGGETAIIALLKAGEKRLKKGKSARTPAPTVSTS